MSDRLRAAILAAADAIDDARDELCRLDAVAGDGDHGVTMALAARAVRAVVADTPPDVGPADLLTRLAPAVASVGGAIGPIWATGLLRVAATLRTRPPGAPLTVEDLRRCGEAAEVAIAAIGGAKPGDKTILDALHPMVEALATAASEHLDVSVASVSAAAAATAGAASTAGIVASVGRASRLGERGRGTADPGATSFAIVMRAVVASAIGAPTAGEAAEG